MHSSSASEFYVAQQPTRQGPEVKGEQENKIMAGRMSPNHRKNWPEPTFEQRNCNVHVAATIHIYKANKMLAWNGYQITEKKRQQKDMERSKHELWR